MNKVLIIIGLFLLVFFGCKKQIEPGYLGYELIRAVENGDPAEVEKLLESGADINSQNINGNTALMIASKISYTDEIVEMLKNAGALE